MKRTFQNCIVMLGWCYRYLGLQWVWHQFKPIEPDKAPVGPIWLLGIYVTMAGIAITRYEAKVAIINQRTDTVLALLTSDARQPAQAELASLQQSTCPMEPSVFSPSSVFRSLWDKECIHRPTVERVKLIVTADRVNLEYAFLPGIDLSGAQMFETRAAKANLLSANFQGAFLRSSDFQQSRLCQANFHRACLTGSDLTDADLENANLSASILMGVKFVRAKMKNANLRNADLTGADLTGAEDLTMTQFEGAKLDGAQLPEYLKQDQGKESPNQ